MARKTKTSSLSIEEKLEQALIVPGYEPYKIPDNWCWIGLSAVCSLNNGVKVANMELPYLDVKAIRNNAVISTKNKGVLVGKNQKLILVDGENSGEVFNVPFTGYMGSTFRILNINDKCCESYINYYIDDKRIELKNSKTGSAIPHLNKELFFSFKFPLPPLAEQHRIVERIESIFSKLDEAKEKAQAVIDSFESRRAAILHKAFSGELTEKWREENKIDKNTWEFKKLKDCGTWCGGGTPSMREPLYWENGDILWITAKDMKSDVITHTQLYTNMIGVENSSANYIKKPSVLFVMRSGILRRTFPVSIVKTPFTVNQDLKVLTPEKFNLEYIFYACKAYEKDILKKCMKSGTTVESINSSALMQYEIPVSCENEQKEIVRILETLLAKENEAKQTAESVISQIDSMKKAVLSKAFRGELGTNDVGEESAVELLKEILTEV